MFGIIAVAGEFLYGRFLAKSKTWPQAMFWMFLAGAIFSYELWRCLKAGLGLGVILIAALLIGIFLFGYHIESKKQRR